MGSHTHDLIGIEALRIITMIMIVGLHYLNFGGILWQDAVWNRRIAWCIEALWIMDYYIYVQNILDYITYGPQLFLLRSRLFSTTGYASSMCLRGLKSRTGNRQRYSLAPVLLAWG